MLNALGSGCCGDTQMRWLPWETSRYAFKGPINLHSTTLLITTSHISKAKCTSHSRSSTIQNLAQSASAFFLHTRSFCARTSPPSLWALYQTPIEPGSRYICQWHDPRLALKIQPTNPSYRSGTSTSQLTSTNFNFHNLTTIHHIIKL
jgi:hypothetical protein